MEQTVESADFRVVVLRLELFDVPGCACVVGSGQQRNRLPHGFGFEQDAQLVGFGSITLNQWRNHCTFMRSNAQQFLGFELAQRFAHRHAADTEKVGQILLAQRRATGQTTVEDC
ncbi:hypothetical protein D3C81_1309470 [compost metagenome]